MARSYIFQEVCARIGHQIVSLEKRVFDPKFPGQIGGAYVTANEIICQRCGMSLEEIREKASLGPRPKSASPRQAEHPDVA